jgi:rhodanese-related sulfurtransferase
MSRHLMLIALLAFGAVGLVRGDEQAMRNVPRISIDEVKALMAKKQVILVDVRDPQSFAEGHMPGALNVPFDDIPKYVDAWKKDARVLITYCACTNETTAARAVVDMNAFGITNAKALLGGWHEWIKRGERVER